MELTEHLSPKSVLLVDDEPDLVNEARRVLEGAGFAVVAAGSGEAALGFIEHERPQLVITDVSLPDRTGVEVLTAIRGTYPDMPVIMITAQGQLSEAREALRQGASISSRNRGRPKTL